jgi:hypothetical protein
MLRSIAALRSTRRDPSRETRRSAGLALWVCVACLWAAPARADEDPLLAKVEAFRASLVERHLTREGVVAYEVPLSTIAEDLVRGTYPALSDSPVHTGLWAATACHEARLARDPTRALADADRALAGLELLMNVTGVRGLLARSLRRDAGRDTSGLRGTWFPGGPGYESYVWRGDVSVDQYASGLLPAAAECAHAFPARVARLVTDFAAHLEAHDLKLVDADGRRTRFGDLSRWSGLGFNSIFQLTGYAAFALGAELSGDPQLARRRDALRDRDRVVARGRTTNLRLFGITNHSNDLMAFSLYRVLIPLARRSGDPALADLRHGLRRSWLRVREDENPYFASLFCVLEPQACDPAELARARVFLERFPLEKRRLPPSAEYLAIPRRWLPGRKLRPLARTLVPIELRAPSTLEWKSSPYRLDFSSAPDLESTGIDFMAAYWMLREAESLQR